MSEKTWAGEPFWGLGYEWDPDWVYTDKQHAPTRKSTFYQVKDGKIVKISDPIDPPAR